MTQKRVIADRAAAAVETVFRAAREIVEAERQWEEAKKSRRERSAALVERAKEGVQHEPR